MELECHDPLDSTRLIELDVPLIKRNYFLSFTVVVPRVALDDPQQDPATQALDKHNERLRLVRNLRAAGGI